VENITTAQWMTIGFVWLLNAGICTWNSWVIGKVWYAAKQEGGLWINFVIRCAYVMTIGGFSWCLLLPFSLCAYANHWFGYGAHEFLVTMSLGYLIFGTVITFFGIAVWIDSVVTAMKTRRFGDVAVATWNTAAQVHNLYEYSHNVGGVWDSVAEFFSGSFGGSSGDSDDDGGKAALALLVAGLALLSLLGGWLLASGISSAAARSERR
jgi:hypothetical protein